MQNSTEMGFDSIQDDQPKLGKDQREGYTLNQGQIESLRVELSMISPEKQKEVQELAQQAVEKLLIKYAKNFPENHKDDEISQRIIVTNDQALSNFPDVWTMNERGEVHCVGDYEETFGKFVVVTGEAKKYWRQLSPEWQSNLIQRFGSEAEAQRYAQEWGMASAIVHEITHHQQPEYLYQEKYEMFLEGGTTIVEAQMAEELGIQPFPDTLKRPEYEAFMRLQQEVGDIALEVLFGHNSDSNVVEQIVAAFDYQYSQINSEVYNVPTPLAHEASERGRQEETMNSHESVALPNLMGFNETQDMASIRQQLVERLSQSGEAELTDEARVALNNYRDLADQHLDQFPDEPTRSRAMVGYLLTVAEAYYQGGNLQLWSDKLAEAYENAYNANLDQELLDNLYRRTLVALVSAFPSEEVGAILNPNEASPAVIESAPEEVVNVLDVDELLGLVYTSLLAVGEDPDAYLSERGLM